jgi:hypothetical protein
MVNLWRSAADRIRVPARPAQHVHRRVPDVRRRTRRSASTVEGGYTGHDRRTCRRGSRGSASTCAGGRAGGRNPATLLCLCRARDALALSSKHGIGAPIAAASSAHVKEEETEKHSGDTLVLYR